MADHTNVEDPLGDYDPGEPPAFEDAAGYPDEDNPFTEPYSGDFGPAPEEPSFGPDDELTYSDAPPEGYEPVGEPVVSGQRSASVPGDVRDAAYAAWLTVAAAALQNGTPANRARELVAQLRAAEPMYRVLGEDLALRCKAALRTVDAILSDVADDGEL